MERLSSAGPPPSGAVPHAHAKVHRRPASRPRTTVGRTIDRAQAPQRDTAIDYTRRAVTTRRLSYNRRASSTPHHAFESRYPPRALRCRRATLLMTPITMAGRRAGARGETTRSLCREYLGVRGGTARCAETGGAPVPQRGPSEPVGHMRSRGNAVQPGCITGRMQRGFRRGLLASTVACGLLVGLLWACAPAGDVDALRLAAEEGDVEAKLDLGEMYGEGRGVPQDDAEAARWLRLAAEQGLAAAQGRLGEMYAEGRGVPQSGAEAARWLRLAAEQGLAAAQGQLGALYAGGRGIPRDDAEAQRWVRLAADEGDARAQGQLGALYAGGRGGRAGRRGGGAVDSARGGPGAGRGAEPARHAVRGGAGGSPG